MFKAFSTPTWISSNFQIFLKFSERQVQHFKVFCKIYTNSFIIYRFLKHFPNNFEVSSKLFQIFLWFFFQNFNKYYLKLKTNTFFKFLLYFLDSSSVPNWHFIKFFCKFLKIFFQKFTLSFDKVTVEVCSNFYSGLLKNFLANFRSILKFFSTLKLFLSNN